MLNYSIHTYELYANITLNEFWQIYNTLKGLNISLEKHTENYESYNSLEITEYIARKLPYHGINSIRLYKADSPYAAIKCILYIIINLYNAYTNQCYSNEKIINAEHIESALKKIDRHLFSFLPASIYTNLKPRRIDFCVNLHFDTQLQAKEYIGLLRLGVPFKSLKEHTEYDSIQKRKVPYPDSLLLQCKSYSFEIYSKYDQMNAHNLFSSPQNAAGIVRIELRTNRSKLKTISKKYDINLITENYADSLINISDIAQNEIHHILYNMVGGGSFQTYTYVKEQILHSNLSPNQKDIMLLIITYFSKKQKSQELLTKFGIKRSEWNRILQHFNSLKCSPITIPRSFSQGYYPGINEWSTYFR